MARMAHNPLFVPKQILRKLGGNQFIAMTGAKQFISGEDFLQFKIPGSIGVRITLKAGDTYRMTFVKLRGDKVTPLASLKDVYAEDLRQLFTDVTGLDTRL